MQRLEHRLGQPLEDYLRQQYIDERKDQRQIAQELGVDVGSISRWMARLGVEARPSWHRKAAV